MQDYVLFSWSFNDVWHFKNVSQFKRLVWIKIFKFPVSQTLDLKRKGNVLKLYLARLMPVVRPHWFGYTDGNLNIGLMYIFVLNVSHGSFWRKKRNYIWLMSFINHNCRTSTKRWVSWISDLIFSFYYIHLQKTYRLLINVI